MYKASTSIQQLLDKLDGRGSDPEWEAVRVLRERVGNGLPQLLLSQFRKSRLAGARASCVYHAMRYARTEPAAVQLGREALLDRSMKVRYRACMLLSFAQKVEVLVDLRKALATATGENQQDVAAAIDAIESGNHHYFADRTHSGMVTLNIVDLESQSD